MTEGEGQRCAHLPPLSPDLFSRSTGAGQCWAWDGKRWLVRFIPHAYFQQWPFFFFSGAARTVAGFG